MGRIITKVKNNARDSENKSVQNVVGWQSVLVDINADIERLRELVPIVERKIARGEPWPGEAATR